MMHSETYTLVALWAHDETHRAVVIDQSLIEDQATGFCLRQNMYAVECSG